MNQETTDSPWENEIISTGFSQRMPFCERQFAHIHGDMGTNEADFEVSEIPAYMPSGEGEHLYLWIEKTGKSTQDVLKAVQKCFGVKEIDVGCAGKKDVHAVTRQWVSVQTKADPSKAIEEIEAPGGIKVLQVTRHTNKLHMGHLRGNIFKVRLNGVTAGDDVIRASLQWLGQNGFINYFGRQRFGLNGDNVAQGLRMLAGGKAPHQLKKLYISAVQSAIFNLMAARRYQTMGWKVSAGDVMQKINAGCFICDDPETDNPRAERGEIVVTLPLIGKKYMHERGESDRFIQDATQVFFDHWRSEMPEASLMPEMLNRFVDGTRRAFWVRPDRLSFQRIDSGSIAIEFALPSGSYATVFLRHLCGCSFTR